MPIESLSYVLFNGTMNPAESHWFCSDIQDEWSCYHMIKSLLYEIKGKILPEEENSTVKCVQGVHIVV